MSSAFLVRRLLATIPLLLGISIVLFGILHLAPGGPLDVYADNPGVTAAALAEMKAAFGLDKPLHEQYLAWIGNFLNGHWGFSIRTSRPVLQTIAERLPATLLLSGTAFALSIAIALPLGIVAATRRYSRLDYALTLFSFSGISIPVFWMGLMAQLTFSVLLGWLPTGGYHTIGGGGLADRLAHMAMPVTILTVATVAGWSRYMRASMIEVLSQDYIRTARAKGQSRAGVVLGHGLRNALLPVITVVSLDIVHVVSGAVITETIFSWPGIGRLFVEAMNGRDYPVLMGLMMIGSVTMVFANLLADMLYAAVDPRIRHA